MLQRKSRLPRTLMVTLLVVAGLLLLISSAFALNKYLKTWQDLYPHSATADANCSLCHGTSTSNLNAYGKDLCLQFSNGIPADITSALQAIEGQNSDADVGPFSNIQEIDANAQPGWTAGPNNQIYAGLDSGCAPVGSPISPPVGVPLPFDPPTDGAPVADPGGPYTGNVNVPITFDGSASYDSDGGDIVSYEWDFGDGTIGTGIMPQHTYVSAGTFIVTLTVTDDEGSTNTNQTTATISGDAVLDLDIAALKVSRTGRVGKSVSIELAVENGGTVLGQAFATVVGMQDGQQVYSWRLNVYDYNGKGTTNFTFPSYTPAAAGTIEWTATIADVDPDLDEATATTIVK